MRFVILGAGAVGGVIGGLLWSAGQDVVLVARCPHLSALQDQGLTLERPEGRVQLPVPVLAPPTIEARDVVILAVKSQDTEAALQGFPEGTTVVCTQNGVENEELALARNPVLGMLVWMFALHLEPGAVAIYSSGSPGVLDLGPWPHSSPAPELPAIAEALRSAGFDVQVRKDIRSWKFGKLLCNLPGALAALGRSATRELSEELMREGQACFDAGGIEYIPPMQLRKRCTDVSPGRIAGQARPGGSLWQSRQRGADSEIQWLTGFIVELGKKLGVPTPRNAELLAASGF